jgi:hypothetical protein
MCVKREKLESILGKAAEKVDSEARRIAGIKEGKVSAPWLNQALVTAGVIKAGEEL